MDTSLIPTHPAGTELATMSPMAALLAEWHKALALRVAANELASASATTYKAGMMKFALWLTAEDCTATPDSIRQWKAELLDKVDQHGKPKKPAKPRSVNAWLAGVRAFYSWALDAGRMSYDPTKGMKGATRRGTTKRHEREALDNYEMGQLLDVAKTLPARNRAIVVLFAYTGARQIELQRADLGDLRTESGELVLMVQGKGHTDKDEPVVIAHADARVSMSAWLAERGGQPGPLFLSLGNNNQRGRLTTRTIRGVVKDAYKLAGIVGDRKTTHSLRHTAISNILRNGGTLQQAQAVARHSNIATTGIYVHEMDRISNAGERLINYGTR